MIRSGSINSSRRSTTVSSAPRLWRGVARSSSPLFGYDLEDYDTYSGKARCTQIRERKGQWPGSEHTKPFRGSPSITPMQDPLPLWIAVGGAPNSVARAPTIGLPDARHRKQSTITSLSLRRALSADRKQGGT
jgi:hypothetical protein